MNPSEQAKLRVENELKELTNKINGLAAFICSENYHELPTIQQNLLRNQLKHMISYGSVLSYRLTVWE